MNLHSLLLKTVTVLLLLSLLSLAGAITLPAFSTISTSIGLNGLLLFLVLMIILSVIGNLLGRGIHSIKKPLEALIIAFVGSFFLGASLIIFTVLNVPGTLRLNVNWLGTNWYSGFLTFLFVGAPLMLVFMIVD